MSVSGSCRRFLSAQGVWGAEVVVQGTLPAPPWPVFTALTEPRLIRALPTVSALEVLQEGAPVPWGPGCVRDVVLGPGRFREQVMDWDPPWRLTYAVLESDAPIEHFGGRIVLSDATGGATRLEWTSAFHVEVGDTPLDDTVEGAVEWWAGHRMAALLARHARAVGRLAAGRSTSVLP